MMFLEMEVGDLCSSSTERRQAETESPPQMKWNASRRSVIPPGTAGVRNSLMTEPNADSSLGLLHCRNTSSRRGLERSKAEDNSTGVSHEVSRQPGVGGGGDGGAGGDGGVDHQRQRYLGRNVVSGRGLV